MKSCKSLFLMIAVLAVVVPFFAEDKIIQSAVDGRAAEARRPARRLGPRCP